MGNINKRLIKAIKNGDEKTALELVKKCDIEQTYDSRTNLLYCAIEYKRSDVVIALLDRGYPSVFCSYEINDKILGRYGEDYIFKYPLLMLYNNKMTDAFEKLYMYQISGKNHIYRAVCMGHNIDEINYLIKLSNDTDKKNILHHALYNGLMPIIKKLILDIDVTSHVWFYIGSLDSDKYDMREKYYSKYNLACNSLIIACYLNYEDITNMIMDVDFCSDYDYSNILDRTDGKISWFKKKQYIKMELNGISKRERYGYCC